MKACCLLILIFVHTVLWSQDCGNVNGKITEQGGDGLPGANIRLKSDPSKGTSSRPDGTFELPVNGIDTLIVSFVGYDDRWVPVGGPNSCTPVISLAANSSTMDEIVVTAQKLIAEEFKTNSFNQLDIYLNPGSKADPILAVNALPAATTLDESANISLRGSSPAETGIFLDNVPVHDAVRYSQLNGIGTFSIFNTQLISNVQVFPGNPPLEFGGTTSGLIALDTKSTIPSRISQKLSLTLASIGWFGEFKTGQRSALTVFTNYQPSGMLKVVNESALARLKKFDSNDLGIHWYLKTKSNGQLKIFNYSLRETYRFDYVEPTFAGDFNQKKKRNFTVASLQQPMGKLQLSVNQGLSFSSANYGFGIASFNLKLKDYYTSVNLGEVKRVFDWKLGIAREVRYSDFNGTYPIYDYAVGPEYPHISSVAASSIATTEAYSYVKYHGTERLSIGAGVRAHLPTNGIESRLSYQFNTRLEVSKPLALLLSYGRYNKYEFSQGPEQSMLLSSDQLSADLIYKKNNIEGTLSLFSKRVSQPGTTAKVDGGELYVKYSKGRRLQAQISLTSLNASVNDGTTKYSSPYDLKYFIRGNVIYSFLGTWSFSTIVLYRQGSFYNPVVATSFDNQLGVYIPTYADNSGQVRLPYYGNIYCTVSKLYTIADKYSAVAFAGLSNVLNRQNVRGYLYNFDYSNANEDLLSGRTLYFGTVINF
jgi:CarboxypepD_reg-like domain/TonB-dependent Receptor Plug Domain